MSAKGKIIYIDKGALKRKVNKTKNKVTQSAKQQSMRILEKAEQKAKDNRNRIQNKLVDSGLFINDRSRDLLERFRR